MNASLFQKKKEKRKDLKERMKAYLEIKGLGSRSQNESHQDNILMFPVICSIMSINIWTGRLH